MHFCNFLNIILYIPALLGLLHPTSQEAAFANFQIWQSAAFVFLTCISLFDSVLVLHKLFILLGLLIIGMFLYYILEWLLRRDALKVME